MRGTVEVGENYGVYLLDGGTDCTRPQRVGIGTATTNPSATTISAGTTKTVEILIIKANKTSCDVRWSFTPVASRSYLVSAASKSGGCAALVLDVTNPDAVKVEPSLRRRNVAGNACVPLAMSKLVAPATDPKGSPDDDSDLPISTETRNAGKGGLDAGSSADSSGLTGR
jgi:hypothetical protein